MVNRIAAWEALDGTVHKTREEADRHDFEQYASQKLRRFHDNHFADPERRWSADEIYLVLLKNAQELAQCFPARNSSLGEALVGPSLVRRREPNDLAPSSAGAANGGGIAHPAGTHSPGNGRAH